MGSPSAETRSKIAAARRKYPAGYGDGSRLYVIWRNMRRRCSKEDDEHYPRYGGRGIRVCPEWEADYATFLSWALASGYAPDLTIDRRNNDGNYEPGNCRWATVKEQANNRGDNIGPITAFGERKTIAEWGEDPRCTAGWNVFRQRLRLGWEPKRALSEPVADRAGPAATHCLHGHEYTPENTAFDRNGYRDCRRCRWEKDQRRRARQKAERRARGLQRPGPKPRT